LATKRGIEGTDAWAYSNYGFVLLSAIIEYVTGQSYYEYVREHVFQPAGMMATDSLPEAASVPGLSVGYVGSGSKVVANTETLPYRRTSAGGGYSTVADMIRFVAALILRPLLSDAVASDPAEDRFLCHPLGAS
jgi:D-alanyl-D-alanine carboxypeptidase